MKSAKENFEMKNESSPGGPIDAKNEGCNCQKLVMADVILYDMLMVRLCYQFFSK